MVELHRQLFHIFSGLTLVFIGALIGKTAFLLFLVSLFLLALLLSNFVVIGFENKLVSFLMHNFDRRDVLPFKGAITYLLGALFAVSMINPFELGLTIIVVLAVGDGFSTLVGYFKGENKLPWNEKKSFEGLAAFVITSFLVLVLLVSWQQAVFYSVLLGLVESVDWQVDDNLSIPAAAWIVYLIA
ncbi:MAG: hypothetical protein ABH803_04590 [Candidatus Micrarchaeota archaeon]